MNMNALRFILLILMLTIWCEPSAWAQDVYLKPHKTQTAETQAPSTPTITALPDEQTQPGAMATPMVDEATAQRYYQNCLAQKSGDSALQERSQEQLCNCTAHKLTQVMSIEQMQTMITNTPEGAAQRDRMIAEIYVPCMQYPVQDLVYANCASEPLLRNSLKNHHDVCACLAEGMGSYVAKNSPSMMHDIITKTSGALDIRTALNGMIESPEFGNASKEQIRLCIQTHEMER